MLGASSTRPDERLSTTSLASELAAAALADAGVRAPDLSAVFVGAASADPHRAGEAVAVRLGLRRLGLRSVEAHEQPAAGRRVEHVSVSGVQALHRAFRAIESGIDELVLCIGTDQVSDSGPPWSTWPSRAVLRARAGAARRYLTASGATATQLAHVVTKNRRHGAARGVSTRLALRDVLDGDVAEWPLTRQMVATRGSGGAALVLASRSAARRVGRPPVCVAASVLAATETEGDPESLARAAREAYEHAGLGPEDLDCAELHDATAAAELAAYEELGIAPDGHGGELVESGFTAADGVLPVNVSGGLLSLGERPGACAIAQVAELTGQLRGEAPFGQVAGARTALAHCAGRPGADAGVVGVTLLTA